VGINFNKPAWSFNVTRLLDCRTEGLFHSIGAQVSLGMTADERYQVAHTVCVDRLYVLDTPVQSFHSRFISVVLIMIFGYRSHAYVEYIKKYIF